MPVTQKFGANPTLRATVLHKHLQGRVIAYIPLIIVLHSPVCSKRVLAVALPRVPSNPNSLKSS
jgi:hypothetical protein